MAWIVFAWAVREILNDIVAHNSVTQLHGFIGIVLASITQLADSAGANYLRERYGVAVTKNVRIGMFAHLLHAPLTLHDSYQLGDLQSRLLSDSGAVERLLASELVTLVQQPLLVAMSFGYLLILNPRSGWWLAP